ncbi:hypothetical protein IV203_028552 [Nitzschia inconspicua]|uniref:Uncharacterized protein n=1 Tax=Nitzschia inconspicua TaxID=303405 RepID=A0A9K3LPT2_9STRA|nr:hypothetical protein IV203_028552 [Nitzschia inconspicua]
MMMSSLSQRIQEIQKEESIQAERQQQELSSRMKRIQESECIQEFLESTVSNVSSDTTNYNDPYSRLVQLPVICFDAILPKQEMNGRAEDPLFCEFLRDQVGIGGWFVMTSLNYFTRTIRRHGTIVKLVAMDAPTLSDKNRNQIGRVPTAVDFSIVGHSRCRVVGPRTDMKQRIGRWRRAYDPNGEEMMLGWGEERFTDAPDELTSMISMDDIDDDDNDTILHNIANNNRRSRKMWTDCWVEVNLEQAERGGEEEEQDDEETSDKTLSLQESLPALVDQWYELASDVGTYKNVNVTASTRIKKGAPGLLVEPQKVLQRVKNQLGPRPCAKENPIAFCFWTAALINPLPVLGVSLEIRGKLLEAPTVEKRLKIVEMGLQRSIDNLNGKAPL